MKASQVQVGDRMPGEYKVLDVHGTRTTDGQEVIVLRVRFADGGDGLRRFFPQDEVPLARPF